MEKHIMHGFLAFWMERLISVWEFYKKTGTLPDGSMGPSHTGMMTRVSRLMTRETLP